MTRILLSSLLIAGSLTAMAPAGAVVPGSDTYERAAENAAIQSVITGEAAGRSPRGSSSGIETRSFGFPNQRTTDRNLVPGSESLDDARAIDRTVRGVGFRRALVPGSDAW